MERLYVKDFLIQAQNTVLEALEKMNVNRNGFLVVVSEDNKLQGTLTDGDIRRALLKGEVLTNTIEKCFQTDCKSIATEEDFSVVIDIFKSRSIEFLPIVNSENEVVNIITKRQMHALLLKNISVTLEYDFLSLDEDIVDYEIFQRPWGFYKTTVLNDYFQSKVIHVKPNASLSLQMHNHREEHWVIVHGTGKVQIGESFIEVRGGSVLFIPKGCKHRLINTSETEMLILTEVQIGDYFGEDDIIRFDDIYGRA